MTRTSKIGLYVFAVRSWSRCTSQIFQLGPNVMRLRFFFVCDTNVSYHFLVEWEKCLHNISGWVRKMSYTIVLFNKLRYSIVSSHGRLRIVYGYCCKKLFIVCSLSIFFHEPSSTMIFRYIYLHLPGTTEFWKSSSAPSHLNQHPSFLLIL